MKLDYRPLGVTANNLDVMLERMGQSVRPGGEYRVWTEL